MNLPKSGEENPELDEPYIFHFPDGNASIARMLVRSLVPGALPCHTMEDIVTARANYARLDDASSTVRIRLNSTVVRAKHIGDPDPDPKTAKEVEVTYVRGGQAHRVRGADCVLACYNAVIPYLCPDVSVIGPSGCGKSTLFNVIAGLQKPSAGAVSIDGEEATGTIGRVGYMMQKDQLLPWRTVIDNVILGMEIKGVPRKRARATARPFLARYGLGGFEDAYPRQLSGGMRQRAGLLRTLLLDTDIVLLDEPFGALDAQTKGTMQEWLLRSSGTISARRWSSSPMTSTRRSISRTKSW